MRHLTDEELDAMVMGVEDADALRAHMLECAQCRAKLVEMRAMVDGFREGVLLWEPREAKTNSGVSPLRASRSGRDDGGKKRYSWRMVPAMGLAAVLAVGVIAPHWMQERRAAEQARVQRQMLQQQQVQQAAATTDDVLMQQVQQQLDEDVPTSMAPLTALIQTEDPHKAARQTKEN